MKGSIHKLWHGLCAAVVGISLMAGCARAVPTASRSESLTVNVLYPTADSNTKMGQSLKSIVKVLDAQGQRVTDAQVTVSVVDPTGNVISSLPAAAGSADLYRTDGWIIPHRMQAGDWTIHAEAVTENGGGTGTTTFRVANSISETLLEKYGFWVDAPTLKGIVPDLMKEKGDAQNGLIIYGGLLMAPHIFVENWLEVQWREGDFHLATEDQVREFMLDTLGDFGFTPVRALGPFERVKFKGWDAWQVKARGQFSRYDGQWMIFYAPEAGKTYALGTTVVLPPPGIDPHATLRDGFEVHPELQSQGVAPQPLARLLPPPEPISPALETRFTGIGQPIVLKWKPLKELARDEYYRVRVDYNYDEANPMVEYATRETELTVPASLYNVPNCGVFNWRVTLMRQTGVGEGGEPEGEELSYSSLYWYFEWFHPLGEDVPFDPLCPNPQT